MAIKNKIKKCTCQISLANTINRVQFIWVPQKYSYNINPLSNKGQIGIYLPD
jgi:hypothetical protein